MFSLRPRDESTQPTVDARCNAAFQASSQGEKLDEEIETEALPSLSYRDKRATK